MISDGDSKIFKLVSNQLSYVAYLVSKHECVGNVQKRMDTALREKAKEKFVNERGEHVSMRGKGQLTDKTIKNCRLVIMAKLSDPTPVTVRQCRMLSGRYLTSPSPKTAGYSTTIGPVPAVLLHVQQGTCQFQTFPPHSPTIHPDIVPPLKSVFDRPLTLH